MSQNKQGKYRFNEFEVDLAQRSLRRDGNVVTIGSRTFDLLSFFLTRPQRLVTQEELMDALWPNAIAEESNLNQHVFLLRRALTGARSGDKLILTFPGRGYQFTASVTRIQDPALAYPENLPKGQEVPVTTEFANRVEESVDMSLMPRPLKLTPWTGTAILEHDDEGDRLSVEALATPGPNAELDPDRGADPRSNLMLDLEQDERSKDVFGPWLVFFLLAAISLTALGGWLGWRWVHRPVADSLGLVIADFNNSTGIPQFDLSIRTAATLDLQQSPFLRISGEQLLRDAIANIKASARQSETQPIARQVCRRLNDQAYLTGEVHRLALKFMVTLEAFDCATAKSIAKSKGIADSPDGILVVLDKVAVDLRKQLGEPSGSVARFSKPLLAGHAESLEAFKAYSDAREHQLEGKLPDAIPLFQHAIELDPQFTNAYADLGILDAGLGDEEIARASLAKAYAMRELVGEYRRLFITAAYDDLVTGDLLASIRNEKEGISLYPRNDVFPSNLASFEIQAGKPAMALDPARRSIELNPDNGAAYADLAHAQMSLGQLDEAAQTCQKAIDRQLDGPEIHGFLLQIAYLRLDQPAMDEQIGWARQVQNPDAESYMLLQQGLIAFAEGKAKAAMSIFTNLIEGYRKQGQSELANRIQSRVPRMEAELGMVEAAHALLVRLPDGSAIDSADLPVAWAETGDTSRAQGILKSALDAHPSSTLWQEERGPQIGAAIALNRQQPAAAIQTLESALPYDMLGFDATAMRGRAYLALKQPDLAEREFHKILDHSGVEPFSYNYALAYLGLARALAQQGKTADARAAYNVFFSIWKDADSDLPRLKSAKEEYARLTGAPVRITPDRTAAVGTAAVRTAPVRIKPGALNHPAGAKPSAIKQ